MNNIKNTNELFTIIGIKSLSDIDHPHIGMNTLVLCDLDDTVLKMPGFEGSDSWFRWQLELIKDNSSYKHGRIAVDKEHLVQALLEIYTKVTPKPLEGQSTIDFVARCILNGAELAFVTARGSETKSATAMHIQSALGITDDQYKLILCSGQSKAEMATSSIDLSQYSHIIFIDDRFENIKDMVHNLKLTEGQNLTCYYLKSPENTMEIP